MSNKKNPCVFLDLSLDGIAAKRIVIELFADEVPKTAENFRLLCAGQMVVEGSTTLHYKGTEFSRIHMGAFAQGGVFSNQNQNGTSIHERRLYADAKTNTRCSEYGVLAVQTCTKGLKFHIILNPWPDHDRVQAVFGKVIDGMETVKKIDSMGTPTGKPSGKVIITNSGEIPEEDKNKYVMESDQVEREEPRKTLTRSNYASKYYHYRRKRLASSKSNSDPEIYKSLLAKFREDAKILKAQQKKKAMVMHSDKGSEPAENFKGRKDKIRKKPSDDISQGRVTKKRVPTSTVGDEKEHQLSKSFEEEMEAFLDEEFEAKLMVQVAKMNFNVFEHYVEFDKGKPAMEFHYSKTKYWSSSSTSYSGYRSGPLVDDTEFHHLRHRRICSERNLYPKSCISYSSE
ncbi:putative peptidylprolyl isomerase [Helianthus annuus]|uniref:Peptidylprolyl isomerase n=1 Tax=Helianthus annuus TaxID=4232 RepID=A0A9K3NT17_HELAN|nr:putative peptidylprolyl isomerase [Helianthus annuus]KAJ0582416.1 putative peptidylprolyl isomerase [Helianthus annuus]KAJ0590648.1 putative peptidylprolyl isomerase [Helianthus annuus]KAJ0598398.1 putative peptidylprolyl isomerase [Helianthus annuus]KAJ0932907.1 putative peptidylprolyl isomerase [Helianthus annuus]